MNKYKFSRSEVRQLHLLTARISWWLAEYAYREGKLPKNALKQSVAKPSVGADRWDSARLWQDVLNVADTGPGVQSVDLEMVPEAAQKGPLAPSLSTDDHIIGLLARGDLCLALVAVLSEQRIPHKDPHPPRVQATLDQFRGEETRVEAENSPRTWDRQTSRLPSLVTVSDPPMSDHQ